MSGTVILVPRRDGFKQRDRTWAWVKAWWAEQFPELPIIEGHHTVGLFNRSAALNLASELAGDWDTAVIIDSDIICDPGRVRQGIATATDTGRLTVPFTVRNNMDQRGSERVMRGERGPWEGFIARRYYDQHSSCIVVPRTVWDTVGGFDEMFAGWGMEDTAFAIAAETLVGRIERIEGDCWHLYHPSAPEGHINTPSANANRSRGARYQAAEGNPDAIRALMAEQSQLHTTEHEIPRIFHRVVPERTSDEVEGYWAALQELHPGWRFLTHRDPLVPREWPETSSRWRVVTSGASLADLIRLEALWRWGGIYVDSDFEPFASFEPLLPLQAFAAWEDHRTVPNAVMGARREHPAIRLCLDEAKRAVRRSTWDGGPGVTTKVLVGRPDVLLFPPGTFYPVHYRDPDRDALMAATDQLRQLQPWALGLHRYAGSWLKREKSA